MYLLDCNFPIHLTYGLPHPVNCMIHKAVMNGEVNRRVMSDENSIQCSGHAQREKYRRSIKAQMYVPMKIHTLYNCPCEPLNEAISISNPQ